MSSQCKLWSSILRCLKEGRHLASKTKKGLRCVIENGRKWSKPIDHHGLCWPAWRLQCITDTRSDMWLSKGLYQVYKKTVCINPFPLKNITTAVYESTKSKLRCTSKQESKSWSLVDWSAVLITWPLGQETWVRFSAELIFIHFFVISINFCSYSIHELLGYTTRS